MHFGHFSSTLTAGPCYGEYARVKYFTITFLIAASLMAVLLYGLFAAIGENLPSPQKLGDIEQSVATRILDRNGQLLAEFFVEDRVPLRLSQNPRHFTKAILAIEDRKFYQHWGIDPFGVLRAARADLLRRNTSQGASTITMQLARNVFLHHGRTWDRKVRETILALRIERAFGKDEILELYLNQIYFGEGAYGLEAAARRFCGVSATELNLGQCAMIAGIAGNPAAFSPRRHPSSCLRRRNIVLRAMLETGAIDEETYHVTRELPLELKERRPAARRGAYFTESVRQQLARDYGGSYIYHGGLMVETTLDLELQEAAEEIVEAHIQSIERRNNYPYLRGEADSMLAPLGLPPAATLPAPLRLQAALVAIEPSTGAIRALVGGRDFVESPFNRATQAPRQPASAFKPFIYAEAIRSGLRTTDLLLDAPVEFEVQAVAEEDRIWKIQNFEEAFNGPVTLRYALMKSINVPTARLIYDLTPRRVIALAHQLGIRSPLPEVLSLATGTGELTLLEMSSTYGVFANQGIRVEPHSVDRIFDRQGHLLASHVPTSRQVLDERTSYITTNMLQSVMDHGTGQTARSIWGFHAPAAGKTGTNDDCTDAWFIGYTPDLVVGVWVGFDVRVSIGDNRTGTGAMAALPIWAQFMKRAAQRDGSRNFQIPAGISFVETCQESGLLATPSCPNPIQDVFIPGTEPQEHCRLHRGGGEATGDFRDLDRQLLNRDTWRR